MFSKGKIVLTFLGKIFSGGLNVFRVGKIEGGKIFLNVFS